MKIYQIFREAYLDLRLVKFTYTDDVRVGHEAQVTQTPERNAGIKISLNSNGSPISRVAYT